MKSEGALNKGSARWNELWAMLPELSPDLVAVVSLPSYSVEYINAAGRRMLGLELDESIEGRMLMEYVPNQSLWTLLNDATATASRVGSWVGEFDLRKLNGDEFSCAVMMCVQPAEKGQPESLMMLSRDITQIRRTVSALKVDQRFLRALIENVPDVIYFKDLQSRFVRVNHSFSLKFGMLSPEELIGKTDFDFFTLEHAQPAFDAEQEIIRTEKAVLNLEEKETWPDGRVTWGSTSKLPFYNEYGKVIGTFGITRDITAKKSTEAALAESQRRLINASRLAGMAEVASGVLHNIGNAFNSVNTSVTLMSDRVRDSRVVNLSKVAQLIEEHAPDLSNFFQTDGKGRQLPVYLAQLSKELLREREQLSAELGSLRKAVDHINAVIAMQQNYAHASSMAEDLALPDLVDEALLISSSSFSKDGLEIVRDFTPVLHVRAARHRVLEILINLLSNAHDATVEAGVAARKITVSLRNAPSGRVHVAVRDNGAGISPENLHRIFSFGFTTKKTGHGFGLHNSALAAKEMEGVLYATSDGPGKGAEFVLALPAVTIC